MGLPATTPTTAASAAGEATTAAAGRAGAGTGSGGMGSGGADTATDGGDGAAEFVGGEYTDADIPGGRREVRLFVVVGELLEPGFFQAEENGVGKQFFVELNYADG